MQGSRPWILRYVRHHPSSPLVTDSFGQWERLVAQTGVEGFYFAVHHNVEHYHEPRVFMSQASGRFLKEVLGITAKELALKLESWVIGRLGKLYANYKFTVKVS
jgi:hypothetical protein